GGILDHGNAVLAADRHDLLDAQRNAEGVHGHACGDAPAGAAVPGLAVAQLGVFGQPAAQRLRAKAQRVEIDIHEHGMGADVAERIAGGDEGEGLGDDLVVALDVGQLQGNVEGGGAVNGGDGVLRAGESCDVLLELDDLRAHGGDEVGVDAVDQV